MEIPRVNETATDKDRQLTKKIVGYIGGIYEVEHEAKQIYNARMPADCPCLCYDPIPLLKGSLTLDQAVGMLKELGIEYQWKGECQGCYFNPKTGFVYPVENVDDEGSYLYEKPVAPHDLTVALKALKAALEHDWQCNVTHGAREELCDCHLKKLEEK